MLFLPIILDTLIMTMVVIIALFFSKQNSRPSYAILFLVVYFVARIVNILPIVFDFQPIGVIYNWIGHFLMIAWGLLFLWLSPLKGENIGLTLKQRSGTILPAVLVTIGIIVFKGVFTGLFSGSAPDNFLSETFLFQITMPAIVQEFLHSGILLSLMIIALGDREVEQKFDWNRIIVLAVIVTAFSHGLIFLVRYQPSVQFNLLAFLTPFIGKLFYAWLRLSTGSLLFPVLAYSLSNFVVYIIPFLLK